MEPTKLSSATPELQRKLNSRLERIEGPQAQATQHYNPRPSGASTAPTSVPNGLPSGPARGRVYSAGAVTEKRPSFTGQYPNTSSASELGRRPSYTGFAGSATSSSGELGLRRPGGTALSSRVISSTAPATTDSRRVASMPGAGVVGLASNGVDSARSVDAAKLAALSATAEQYKEELRVERSEIQDLRQQLAESNQMVLMYKEYDAERGQNYQEEKNEMITQVDMMIAAQDELQVEQQGINVQRDELHAERDAMRSNFLAEHNALRNAERELAEERLLRTEAADRFDMARVESDGQPRPAARLTNVSFHTAYTGGRTDGDEIEALERERVQAETEAELTQLRLEKSQAAVQIAELSDEVQRLKLERSQMVEKAQVDGAELQTQVQRLQLEKAQLVEKAIESDDLRAEIERLESALSHASSSDAESASLRDEIAALKSSSEKKDVLLQDKTRQCEAARNREVDTQVQLESLRLENQREIEEKTQQRDEALNRQMDTQLQLEEMRLQLQRQAEAASHASGSEGRLRAVMTSQSVSSDELRSAIGAVQALTDEARRELERQELRERRAACELLGTATDKADETLIEEALVVARKAGLDEGDIKKAEEQLLQLRSMSEEQKAARVARELEAERKKEAFHLVKKDAVEKLQALIDGLDDSVRWMDWRDYAGRTLYKCSQDLRAERVQPMLASLLGIGKQATEPRRDWKAAAAHALRGRGATEQSVGPDEDEAEDCLEAAEPGLDRPRLSTFSRQSSGGRNSHSGRNSLAERLGLVTDDSEAAKQLSGAGCVEEAGPEAIVEEVFDSRPVPSEEELVALKAKALRAVVQNDAGTLEEILDLVPEDIWSTWQNKAGKDLITLSEERGSSLAYGAIAKAAGLLQELKRDTFEEGEDVWIFVPGEVQARRAKVMKDTPEEDDMIYIEYWDGDEPASYVDRAVVRKLG